MTISGLLLAGGRSERMGCDKRLLEVGGKPLIRRSYDVMNRCCGEVLVLIAEQNDEALLGPHLPDNSQFVLDERPHEGPMGALISGLKACRYELGLLLAVDLPFLTAGYLERLSSHALRYEASKDLFVPESEGLLQVTAAIYSRSLVEQLERAFEKGERALHSWIRNHEQNAKIITKDVWGKWGAEDVFVNMNRMNDAEHVNSAIDSQS